MDYNHKCLLGIDKHGSDRENRFKLINVSAKNPKTRHFFRSIGSVQRERRRHAMSPHSYIIHPLSMFRYYWEIMYVILIYASLLIIPLNSCFELSPHDLCHKVESALDVFCMLDIIVSFLSGICIPSILEVITEPKVIKRKRLTSVSFYIDCISSIPDGLIDFYIEPILDNYTNFEIAWSLFDLLKLLRCFKFLRYYNNTTGTLNVYLQLFLKYLLMYLLAFHWLTCIYIYATMFNALFYEELNDFVFSFDGLQIKGQNYKVIYVNSGFVVSSYLFAVNLLSTFQKTISYKFHRLTDILLFIIISIIGFIFCSILTVFMLQILGDVNHSRKTYHQIVAEVNQFCKTRDLSSTIRERLLTYYEYRFRKVYFEEKRILGMLSDSLTKEIFRHNCRTLIDNVTILKDLPQNIISEVISCLHHEVFLYNDIIVKAGTAGDSMYFIASGTVAVSTLTGREVCHLQDGAFFGEIALIVKDHKRIATVVAIEICEVYRLDRNDFRVCFAQNSAYYRKIDQIAKERIGKTALLEELHRKYIIDKTRLKNMT